MANHFSRLDFSDVITVLVGEQEKAFTVHKIYATKTSEFFTTAVNGNWREAKDGIRLPEVEVLPFDLYVRWLYTGEMDLDLSMEGDVTTEIAGAVFAGLMDLYILGHFLLDPTFRNAAIDATIIARNTMSMQPGAPSICQI